MPAPFILVGLGNPGPTYAGTRHNVGFDFLDRVAQVLSLKWRSPWFRPLVLASSPGVVCVKPHTFMNRSGTVLPYLRSRYELDSARFCVVVDNMDLPAGEIRMKSRGGPAGHNGLKSISLALQTDDYSRLYIGIGRPGRNEGAVEHVLGRFTEGERTLVDSAIERVVPLMENLAGLSLEKLISAVNERRRVPERTGP